MVSVMCGLNKQGFAYTLLGLAAVFVLVVVLQLQLGRSLQGSVGVEPHNFSVSTINTSQDKYKPRNSATTAINNAWGGNFNPRSASRFSTPSVHHSLSVFLSLPISFSLYFSLSQSLFLSDTRGGATAEILDNEYE